MKRNKLILFLLCFILVQSIAAQTQTLSMEQAIELALKNNFDIQIAKNKSEQAANNNTLGNAGMLPKLELGASGNFANTDMRQEFLNGTTINKNSVESQNITTGAYLTWTIFDGLKMFASQKKLAELEKMGKTSLKIQIENTLSKVIASYYAVASQIQLINGLNENIAVSEERLKIASKKLEIGTGSKFDVIQAKIDLNELKTSIIKQTTILNNSKAELNQILNQKIDFNYEISDTIPTINPLKYDELQKTIQSNNSDLIYAEKNIEINKFTLRETRSNMMPKVNLNANYLFSRAESQAGFSLLNQNLGMNFGFTATWTIFNGFTNQTATKNLKLSLQNSIHEYERLKTLIELNLYNSFQKFENDLTILKLEEESFLLAKEGLAIALERYKLGTTNSVELKLSQQSYENAVAELAKARYTAKVTETEILKLNGNLIK